MANETTINAISKINKAIDCGLGENGTPCSVCIPILKEAADKYLLILKTRNTNSDNIQPYTSSMLYDAIKASPAGAPVFVHLGLDFPIDEVHAPKSGDFPTGSSVDDYAVVIYPHYGAV